MLQLGKNITSSNDPLKTISVGDLYKMISAPSPDLRSKINQLRILRTIDKQKYQQLKKSLPYVTCGNFSPPYRRTQNFGSITNFILDIDHLTDREMNPDQLKELLSKDDRVGMLFVSPGGDGLKVLFSLTEKCYDSGQYSIFYKLFIHHFSKQYNVIHSVDKVTSDVARACFLSVDENAYYNSSALPINMDAFINFDNEAEVYEAKMQIKDYEKTIKDKKPETDEKDKKELPEELLHDIKKKLNPNIRTKKEKQLYVPEEIDNVVPDIVKRVEEFGVELKNTEPINFGKKMIFGLGSKWAQVNVFFGKKGYKVVKTPKTGSDSELTEVVFQILCEMFY